MCISTTILRGNEHRKQMELKVAKELHLSEQEKGNNYLRQQI